jgi:hypothetical protein
MLHKFYARQIIILITDSFVAICCKAPKQLSPRRLKPTETQDLTYYTMTYRCSQSTQNGTAIFLAKTKSILTNNMYE